MADVRLIDANALQPLMVEVRRNKGIVLDNVVRLEQIRNAPTIDAVPVVHGRWVHFKQHDLNAVFCNVCDYTFARLHPANYCPNCGAKMDVKEE